MEKVVHSGCGGTTLFRSKDTFGLLWLVCGRARDLKDAVVNALTSIAACSATQCLESLLYHKPFYDFPQVIKSNVILRIHCLVC